MNTNDIVKANESFLAELGSTYFENTNVQFRANTDLGHINDALISNLSVNMPSGLDEDEQTQVMVESIDTFLQSEEGMVHFENIKNYSEQFSSIINSSFDTLKNEVTPFVQELTNKIEEKKNELIEKTTHMVELNGSLINKDHNFTIVDLEKFRSEAFIANAKELVAKYYNNKISSVTVTTLKYLSDAISSVDNIKLEKEELDGYANTIAETINNDPSVEVSDQLKAAIISTITPVFNTYEFNSLKSLIINDDLRAGKINESAIRNAYSFSKLGAIYNRLEDIVDIDNEKVLTIFKSNVEKAIDLYKLSTVLLILANEKYEECAVIGENMLNQTGVTKVLQNGGTLEDIHQHIRLYYNNDKSDIIYNEVTHMELPVNGIKADSIIRDMDECRAKYSKLEEQIKAQYKSIVNTATKNAYETVLRDYIHKLEKDTTETTINGIPTRQFCVNARMLVDELSYSLVRFDTSNITDSVYDFYLKTWYKDNLVSNIYYRLGAELITSINKSEDINEDTIKYAHFTVMSDILSEYITKTMIIPSK